MNAEHLLQHFDRLSEAPDAIPRLRRFILDLAVRGKLVEQDPNDEPAAKLLERIQAEKARLVKEKRIKKENPLDPVNTEAYLIPSSWVWTRLGESGRIFNGNSVSDREKTELSKHKDGFPFIATKDVGYGRDHLNYENGLKVPLAATGFKVAHANTILICAEGGSAGKKIGLTDRDICFGNKLYANEVWNGIHPSYILALYESPTFFSEFAARMTGIIGGISRSQFLMLPLPLPPEAEQNRIVAKVDELIALCNQLEAAKTEREQNRDRLVTTSLQRLNQPADTEEAFREHAIFTFNNLPRLTTRPAHIKKLRQTILNLAVRGKLIPQNPNDEPATKLLGRLQSSSSIAKRGRNQETPKTDTQNFPFPCPIGWEWITVQRLIDQQREISYGVIKLGNEPKTGGVSTLRCSDVKPGFIDLSAVRKVSEAIESEYVRTRLHGGEILINIRGTLGGVAKVPNKLRGFNVAREVAVVPIYSELAADFLVYVMLSPYFWDAIQDNLRGIAYKGLNLGTLRDFLVPLPPLAEQHRIVAKVDEMMGLCDQLEAQLTTTEVDSRSLLESVLHEFQPPAF